MIRRKTWRQGPSLVYRGLDPGFRFGSDSGGSLVLPHASLINDDYLYNQLSK
jgi:hypothetical protein